MRRRARSLAVGGGVEPHVSLELLAELLMDEGGEEELRTLNPLLTAADAADVLQQRRAGDVYVLADQLAALLATRRAHVRRQVAAGAGRFFGYCASAHHGL